MADAGSAELAEGAFDTLFSRFGMMFFDDPTGAFAHMRRAFRPGGRVALVCWRGVAENDWIRLPMSAIKGIGGRLQRYRYRALRYFRSV
ncbi:methyltransferase domain-containing protein [Rhizobium binae]|nr:methyltransferase domain-containing protein [Rhizobium binae]